MEIAENLSIIKQSIPNSVSLVAVSKTKPINYIMQAYQAGHKIFGENRPLELQQKYLELPKDIKWHFIGHPQSKQVKYMASFVQMIHGVDSLKLLQVINKEAIKNNRIIDCLLEFHIAEEATKFGLSLQEAKEIIESPEFTALTNIRICGVMGMATFTENTDQIRREFKHLNQIFASLKSNYFEQVDCFKELSMGMSGDYQIAIEEGSTMVRIGSSIFGER